MTDQSSDQTTGFGSTATRLDSVPTRIDSAPTRLESGLATAASVRTLPDRVAPSVGLIQLPTTLRERYRIQQRLPTAGAEADIFVLQSLSGDGNESGMELRVLKLYRYNVVPKASVLEKVRDGNPEHLIRIYEFGQSDDHWYELMEYAAEGSVRKLLRGRPWPTTNLTDMVRELAQALKHLHGFGLIHRDLKPENILIRELMPLDLVITDFGISSLTDLSQRFTSASRTVRYAAPESLSGLISQAVDYWSLGMIVAEACMGRHPFADLSDERAVTQWLTTRPIELSGIADARWQNLCRGLLLRDPQQRWGEAEIVRWLDNDTSLAVPMEAATVTPAPTVGERAGAEIRRSTTPYLIGEAQCWSADELGVALTRHWDTGCKDLARGLLRKWCDKELNDVATERLFYEVEESDASLHDKLLSVIQHLCPDIPACYRGVSLASPQDIAQLIESARSASESGSATLAREIVALIANEGLLERFRSTRKGPNAQLFVRLKAVHEWAVRGGVAEAFRPCLSGHWFNTIKLDRDPFEVSESYDHVRAIALAIAPELGRQTLSDAAEFAATTAWRFWLHDCLDLVHERDQFLDALVLPGLLQTARTWYAKEFHRLWIHPLCDEPMAVAWKELLEADYAKAGSVTQIFESFDPLEVAPVLERLARSFDFPVPTQWHPNFVEQMVQAIGCWRTAPHRLSSIDLATRQWRQKKRLLAELSGWRGDTGVVPKPIFDEVKSTVADILESQDAVALVSVDSKTSLAAQLLEQASRLMDFAKSANVPIDSLVNGPDLGADSLKFTDLGIVWLEWCDTLNAIHKAVASDLRQATAQGLRERSTVELQRALASGGVSGRQWLQWMHLFERLRVSLPSLRAIRALFENRSFATLPMHSAIQRMYQRLLEPVANAIDQHQLILRWLGPLRPVSLEDVECIRNATAFECGHWIGKPLPNYVQTLHVAAHTQSQAFTYVLDGGIELRKRLHVPGPNPVLLPINLLDELIVDGGEPADSKLTHANPLTPVDDFFQMHRANATIGNALDGVSNLPPNYFWAASVRVAGGQSALCIAVPAALALTTENGKHGRVYVSIVDDALVKERKLASLAENIESSHAEEREKSIKKEKERLILEERKKAKETEAKEFEVRRWLENKRNKELELQDDIRFWMIVFSWIGTIVGAFFYVDILRSKDIEVRTVWFYCGVIFNMIFLNLQIRDFSNTVKTLEKSDYPIRFELIVYDVLFLLSQIVLPIATTRSLLDGFSSKSMLLCLVSYVIWPYCFSRSRYTKFGWIRVQVVFCLIISFTLTGVVLV